MANWITPTADPIKVKPRKAGEKKKESPLKYYRKS